MAFPGSMNDVLSLTRSGRLDEATALIQRVLNGGGGQAGDAHNVPRPAGPAVAIPRLALAGPVDDLAPPSGGKADAAAGVSRKVHAGAEGQIAYRLFVPERLSETAPLLIMLHGCTQSPDDFARGTRMDELAKELGFIVAYPEQTRTANAQKCWNWFRPGDQERGRGEPALIAALTREIAATHPVDAERIYVAGLSAGGAAASIMASAYPDLYAAVGIHSGLACGSAKDLPSAFAAMNGTGKGRSRRPAGRYVPTITFHGDSDRTVHPSNSEAILATGAADPGLSSFERRTVEGRSPGGRAFDRTVLSDRDGRSWIEHWEIKGGGHAWSGGDAAGSYTDPSGPDASRAMMEFFLQHHLGTR